MKILALIIGTILFCVCHSLAGEKPNPTETVTLEGCSWKITAAPDEASSKSGAKQFDDTISFANGKFKSATMAAKGFRPAKYRGDFEEREAEFDLEQESDDEGIVIWIGEVRGEKMTGRLQWKRRDGVNLFFNFSGARAAK